MVNNSDIRGVYALGKLWTVLSDATASRHKPTQANEMPEKNLKIINKEIFPYFGIPNGRKSTNFAVDMEH